MAITQTLTTSFMKELSLGTHDFSASTGDTFKIALYDSTATLGAATTVYTATNEISGTGYTPGGAELTSITPTTSGTTTIFDFADVSWTGATFSDVMGALIYNSSKSNKAVCVLNFGTARLVTAGTFTLTMPVADASNAIIRLVPQT